MCEAHNKLYINYCFSCKKNLCQICTEIHYHKINSLVNIDNDIKKFLQYKGNKELSQKLKYILSATYLDKKEKKLFNGRIYEILYNLSINSENKEENVLFKKFGDHEFINYYSKLLENVAEGKVYYFQCLDFIKSQYRTENRNYFDINYYRLIKRENSIQTFIERTKIILSNIKSIHRFMNYDNKINELRFENNKIKIKIIELMTEMLIQKNSNKIFQDNTNKILCRFLADTLIKQIVYKYFNNLETIPFNLSILSDLILNGKKEATLSNKDIIGLSTEKLQKFYESISKYDNNHEEVKDNIIKLFNSPMIIKFSENIIVDNEIFEKEDLNKILDVLFYVKNIGNIKAHPNINVDESLKSVQISSIALESEIESFYKNFLENKFEKKLKNKLCEDHLPKLVEIKEDYEHYYYHLNNFNIINDEHDLFKNLEDYRETSNSDIIKKIEEIRNDLLSNFLVSKMRKTVTVDEVNDAIFSGKSEIIFEKSKDFMKVFIQDTDDVIEKSLSINIKKKFSDENENINNLYKSLKTISNMMKNYLSFQIPKHINYEELINDMIQANNNNCSDISIIENIQDDLAIKDDIETGCIKEEIIAEICFLLLLKTYIKEVQMIESIIKNFETEIIRNLIYEDMENKLKGTYKKIEERFGNNTSIELVEKIKKQYFEGNDSLTLDKVKKILSTILKNGISFSEIKISKLNNNS